MIKEITWYAIIDELPRHLQLVLVYANTRMAVCVFVENEAMAQSLKEHNAPKEPHEEDAPYYFCSQEIPGNVLQNVTYWAAIDGIFPI